ncbi:Zinc finger C2HC domain-containing protein 1C [Cladochytrium tenue]|nr:Zinc finger C2HC domain-containing protein 1C [Cladochytrium tenue]
MTKARVRGTELEQYAMRKDKEPSKPVKKSNWRAKHENFIRMVRANRDAGAAAAAGGPPPPFVPSDPDPDYVLCDHCGRRFSPVAADRHIPICANTKNRPRPAPAARSSGPTASGGSGSAGAAAEAMKRRVGYKPPLPAAPAAPAAKKAGQTGSRSNLAASPARRR